MDLKAPAPFNPNKNQVAKDWQIWKTQYLTYLRLSNGYINLSEEKRAFLLQNLMGRKAVEAMENMTFDDPRDKEDMDILLAKFDEIFDPSLNEVEERYKFFSRGMNKNETIDKYVKDLQELAKKCNFGVQKEKFIIDMIIRNMDRHLRQMIFNKSNITLEDVIESFKQDVVNNKKIKELSENFAEDLKLDKKKGTNNVGKNPDKKKSECQVNINEQTKRPCIKCGTNHPYAQCPAFHNTCYKCHQKGHSAAQCEKLNAARNKNRSLSEQRNACSSSYHDLTWPSPPSAYPTVSRPVISNEAPPSYHQTVAETRNFMQPYSSLEHCLRCELKHLPGNCPLSTREKATLISKTTQDSRGASSFCYSCKNNPTTYCLTCKRQNTSRATENFVKVEHTSIRRQTYTTSHSSNLSNIGKSSSHQNDTKKKSDPCCIS